ncbi:MAG: polysaccharide deacetylase family protein [Ignavibacteriae bacterium]|nr:polysaccharide deacetylase family protein [Ignavibacteriota bacterium]
MVLKVGIMGNGKGWELLLQQEGIPYERIVDFPLSRETFSVIVVGDQITPSSLEAVRRYLTGGGAILCSGRVYALLCNERSTETFVRYLCEEPHSHFQGVGLVNLQKVCHLPWNGSDLRTDAGAFSAFIGTYGEGAIIALPFDAAEFIVDRRTAMKSFYAHSKRLPFEKVSLVPKRGIRRLVRRSLEILHHRRGLPYVHKWFYPDDQRTIFVFRIDTDCATREETAELYKLSRTYNIPCTWFVDVKSQEHHLSVYREMEGQEIGIHCFDHHLANDAKSYNQDIRTAIEIFHSRNLKAMGYAAPYGFWSESLANVIETFGFDYSSEFSYDYDNVPSYPIVNNEFLQTLQIPVHPISIGSLRRQSFTEQEMVTYFHEHLHAAISAREPLIIYHHPKNNYLRVVESIFKYIQEHHIRSMRMIDFALWWKQRNGSQLHVEAENASLHINADTPCDNIALRITRGDGTEAFTSICSTIHLENLIWQPIPKPLPVPDDVVRVTKFNPWILVNHFEDFIFKLLRSR